MVNNNKLDWHKTNIFRIVRGTKDQKLLYFFRIKLRASRYSSGEKINDNEIITNQ